MGRIFAKQRWKRQARQEEQLEQTGAGWGGTACLGNHKRANLFTVVVGLNNERGGKLFQTHNSRKKSQGHKGTHSSIS